MKKYSIFIFSTLLLCDLNAQLILNPVNGIVSTETIMNQLDREFDSDEIGRAIIREKLVLRNVEGEELNIMNLVIDTIEIWDSQFENITFENSKINNLIGGRISIGFSLAIWKCDFELLASSFRGDEGFEFLTIDSSEFNRLFLDTEWINQIDLRGNRINYNYKNHLPDFVDELTIQDLLLDSSFQKGIISELTGRPHLGIRSILGESLLIEGTTESNLSITPQAMINSIQIEGDFESIELVRNQLNVNLHLGGFAGLTIDKSLIVTDNAIGNLAMEKVTLNDSYTIFPYSQLLFEPRLFIYTEHTSEEHALGIASQGGMFPYFGILNREIQDNSRFLKLVQAHSQLYHIAKENGDITSANKIYSDLQELYTRNYQLMYKTQGELKNWFRWRLNQLLKFYVDYGTDPARALVVSFYLMLFFAIFYFFFPSEWDTQTKPQIISNLRSALNRHEKGTMKAYLNALSLLVLSFINAFALSLNAFVTLGFGSIPTRGVARYVCILQGFMGWFLLSLFTVALINQVIF